MSFEPGSAGGDGERRCGVFHARSGVLGRSEQAGEGNREGQEHALHRAALIQQRVAATQSAAMMGADVCGSAKQRTAAPRQIFRLSYRMSRLKSLDLCAPTKTRAVPPKLATGVRDSFENLKGLLTGHVPGPDPRPDYKVDAKHALVYVPLRKQPDGQGH